MQSRMISPDKLLEFLDDVAVHNPDCTVILEQTKSALRQNPLSDWAVDLWKALANWLESVSNGDCRSRENSISAVCDTVPNGSMGPSTK